MISTDVTGAVGTITLARPDKLNALTTDMLAEIGRSVQELSDREVSIIIVRSSSQNFSAGADLNEWAAPTAADAQRMSRIGGAALDVLAQAPMPSLAVIDGVAAGGGLELTLACDLRIATTRSRLGLPEAGLANLPATGGVDRLMALVGASRARELLFTAELIGGQRAAELGLVNWLTEAEHLDSEVVRITELITNADRSSVALAKSLTGGSPIAGPLASFTSQTEQSRARKQAFLGRRKSAATPSQGARS